MPRSTIERTKPVPATGDPQGATAVTAYIGLGANLGDAVATVQAATGAIGRLPQTAVMACSRLYRSAPIESSGPDYINAVIEVTTRLAPAELLSNLQSIEREHGRERPYRNAPRSLDLDLLLYGERVINSPQLCIPHPRMHERAFVLRPLAEIAPNLVIPGRGGLAPLLLQTAEQRITQA